jgi:EAL domain-containing protein (putative c-di-GMP-specific phosphodiesterase class I)/FixJ family two-component response regulator
MQQTLKAARVGLAFVLDDEPKLGAVICRMFQAVGISARHFIHPEQFLREVIRSKPDLVMVDLALGSTDAVEVMRQLETLKFNGRVLLISGRDVNILSEFEQIGRTHALFMLPSLPKPFRIADLAERLHAPPSLLALKSVGEEESSELHSCQSRVTLQEALRRNWLEVWYQPKINLSSFVVGGAEGLIRVRHPDHGIIEPAEFLPPAGDPLYKPLSFFLVRQAMTDWLTFAANGFPLKLAVNVPASTLIAPGFVDLARQMIPHDPRFPGMMVEVTEDEFIRDPESLREVAIRLKLYNTWISIDDFGTAYASLSRLTDLPFVELKLDRSFVSNCASDKLKYALCQTVVDLAHRFGASLCAEGVETADDLRCVTKLGFNTAQGYFLAKPMSLDRLLASLLSHKGCSPAAATSPGSQEPPRSATA